MGTIISGILKSLRDYNYIVSYSKAIEFCYLYSPVFKELPTFPKYFKPFKDMSNRTYYYINDYHQYSLEMLEDDERQKALAIIYIFVVGVTGEEIVRMTNEFMGTQFDMLKKQQPNFEVNVFPYQDFMDMGIKFNESYGYNYPIAFEEAMNSYDIKYDKDTKVAVFAAEFSR
jgi:hypothetical protein